MLRHRLHCKIERAETETYLTGQLPHVTWEDYLLCACYGSEFPKCSLEYSFLWQISYVGGGYLHAVTATCIRLSTAACANHVVDHGYLSAVAAAFSVIGSTATRARALLSNAATYMHLLLVAYI